jgi:NDP-sugar pyrophosphorylase family protein
MNQVVILAGGLATRLQPISSETPKSLISILGIPFVKLQIENLVHLGVENFHFCLGNQAIKIEEYLTTSDFAGINISTSRDSKPNRGTAGALVDASDYIQDDFFLTYGDSYLPVDLVRLEESWANLKSPLKLSIKDVRGTRHLPNVQVEENGAFHYGTNVSEATHIDYGFMKVNKSVISFIKDEEIVNFETVIEKMSVSGSAICSTTNSPLYEIGSFEGIIELESYIGGSK